MGTSDVEADGALSNLHKELRSLTEVISREIRRARAINDPMQDIGSECTTACAGEAVAEIDTAGEIHPGMSIQRTIRPSRTSW